MPIITTNSGGIPEYATEKSAIIVERDANLIINLSDEIEKLIKNHSKQDEMSKKCKSISKSLDTKTYYYNFYGMLQDKEKRK